MNRASSDSGRTNPWNSSCGTCGSVSVAWWLSRNHNTLRLNTGLARRPWRWANPKWRYPRHRSWGKLSRCCKGSPDSCFSWRRRHSHSGSKRILLWSGTHSTGRLFSRYSSLSWRQVATSYTWRSSSNILCHLLLYTEWLSKTSWMQCKTFWSSIKIN